MPAKRIGEEYPAKSGFILTPKKNPSGRNAWRVDIPATRTGGHREQRQFKSKELARGYAAERHNELQRVGHDAFLLTATQRMEAAKAFATLSPHGIGLLEAVTLAVKHLRPTHQRITLEELRSKFLASPGRRHGQLVERRPRSLENFRARTQVLLNYIGSRMADEVIAETSSPSFHHSESNFVKSLAD